MNEILNERIQAAWGALSDEDLSDISEKYGVKAAKQAKRMARQHARTDNFRAIIDKDEDVFPLLDVSVVVDAKRHYYEDYFLALHNAVERAKDKGRGSSVVDGCLVIMAVGAGFGAGAAIAMAGILAMTAWYLTRPRPPRPWDQKAITASFADLLQAWLFIVGAFAG
jgi:hypothetical protein